ncbi:MAG: hypothetical protein Q4G03_11280 [Planctomycetia bacterium]|nr:hypothetical protein [Planctomycetia bacterium]
MTKNYSNGVTVALTVACLCLLTACFHSSIVEAATTNYGSTSNFKDPDEAAYESVDVSNIVDLDDDEDDDPADVFFKVAMRELVKMVESDQPESFSTIGALLVEAVKEDDATKINNLAYAIDRIVKEAMYRTISRTLVRYDPEELVESRKNVRFVTNTLSSEIRKGFSNDFEDYYESSPRIEDSNYNALLLKEYLKELFSSKAREIPEKSTQVSLIEHTLILKTLSFLLIDCADDDDIDVENKNVVAFSFDTIVNHIINDDDDDDDSKGAVINVKRK